MSRGISAVRRLARPEVGSGTNARQPFQNVFHASREVQRWLIPETLGVLTPGGSHGALARAYSHAELAWTILPIEVDT